MVRKLARKVTAETDVRRALETLTLNEIAERFFTEKRLSGIAPRTLEDYQTHYRYFTEFVGRDLLPEEISKEILLQYIDWMLNERNLSPVTVNIRMRPIRSLLRYAYREGYIPREVHTAIKLLKTPDDTIESFTPAEIKTLLKQIDTSRFVGFRDYVMICVLLDTMVRISELLNIRRHNVFLAEGFIKLEAQHTKTRKARNVPISTKTAKLLSQYLRETEDFDDDRLFLTFDGRPLRAIHWRTRLHEYGEMAGITGKRVSPHTFRHTGALFYIMNGGDPFSLQKILGHSDLTMVRKYIQMTNSDVKQQHNQFSPLKNIT
jgi:integrase/recombinase XerD